jgi:AcrR family transcriptional regulator
MPTSIRTPPRVDGARRRVRRRARTPDATRAQVLASARTLFAKYGYAATTTAAIARGADVSEGIIFHWFRSKEALVVALGREFAREVVDAMFAGRGPTDDPVPALSAMLKRTFAYVRERRTLVRLLTLSPDPSSSPAARHASRAALLAPLTTTFAHRSARGLARPMDPRIAAELMFALVEAALVECHVFGDGSREEAYLKETIRCVEGALGVRPARTTATTRRPGHGRPVRPARSRLARRSSRPGRPR